MHRYFSSTCSSDNPRLGQEIVHYLSKNGEQLGVNFLRFSWREAIDQWKRLAMLEGMNGIHLMEQCGAILKVPSMYHSSVSANSYRFWSVARTCMLSLLRACNRL